MDYASSQTTDSFPSLSLEQAFLDGNAIAVGFGDKQGMGWILARLWQTPDGVVRLCQPGSSRCSWICPNDADIFTFAIEEIVEK